jgi:hypothetical protein
MRTDLTLGAAVVALAMFVGAGHLRAAPTKESWEYSGTMDADGMKVPLPATTVCVAADATTPPLDKNCKLSDVNGRVDAQPRQGPEHLQIEVGRWRRGDATDGPQGG